MAETSFPWPAAAPVPRWLLLELERWCVDERVGRLVVDFGASGPQGIERTEKLRAPETGDPIHLEILCPECHINMGAEDYGNRFRCPKCKAAYSRWTLKQRGLM